MNRSSNINFFSILFVLLTTSCSGVFLTTEPVEQVRSDTPEPVTAFATPRREATSTLTDSIQTQEVVFTETPLPTATILPTATPTVDVKNLLPVTHKERFPGKLVQLSVNNLDDIALIGTFGEGKLYSTHYNPTNERLIMIYSSGIDIYQKINGSFAYQNSFDFEIQINDFAYSEPDDLYCLSESNTFFVQNYEVRVKVLNTFTGEYVNIDTSDTEGEGRRYPPHRVRFSPDEKYLVLDTRSAQILIDLLTLKEIYRFDRRQAESNFSEDSAYLLTSLESNFEIYHLPDMTLVGSVVGSFNPVFATITRNQEVVAAFQTVVMVWSFPEFKLKGLIYTAGRSDSMSNKQLEVTRDGRYLINADYDKVRIFDLQELVYTKVFNDSSLFVLSPDEQFLFIMGKSRVLVDMKDFNVIASFSLKTNVNYGFTPSGKHFIAHDAYETYVYDFETSEKIMVHLRDQEKSGYANFMGASDNYVWMHVWAQNEPTQFFRFDLASREKKMFDAGMIPSTNMEFYTDEFILINTGESAQIQRMEDMQRISFLSRHRTSGDHLVRQFKDSSTGVYALNLTTFSNGIKWALDKKDLANAFSYVSQNVSYGQYQLHMKDMESPDGNYRVESEKGVVRIINTGDGSLVRTFYVNGTAQDWVFSPDSNIIYISGSGSSYTSPEWIRAYDISKNLLLREKEYEVIHTYNDGMNNLSVIPIDVSSDGRYLVTADNKAHLHVLDLENGWSEVFTIDIFITNYSDIEFSQDGTFMVSATSSGDLLQFWNADTGELIMEMNPLDGYQTSRERIIQFYLMDEVLVVSEKADPWGRFGQIKVYGILEP